MSESSIQSDGDLSKAEDIQVYSDLIPEVSLRPKYTLTHDHHGMTAEQRTDLWTVWSLNNTCKQLVAVDEVVQQLKLLNGIINK